MKLILKIDTIKVFVTNVNDAPLSESSAINMLEDQEHVDFLYGEDVEEDPLTFHVVMEPSHGTVVLNDDELGEYIYAPDPHYFGPDSFSYSVNDGYIFSDTSMVYVSVFGVNDAPVSQDENISILEDNSYTGSLQVEDVDGDDLTYFITVAPVHGSVELSEEVDGDYLYVPSSNYFGPD